MRVLFRILALTIILLLAPATSLAVAAKLVPPGNSGANQYTETVPGPGGGMPSDEANDDASPTKVLGPSNAARLEALGPEGRAAAQLAAATAPQPVGKGRPGGTEETAPVPNGSSGLGQVLQQITGTSNSGGGMGLLLPLIIALTVIGSIGFAVVRRWRPTQS